MSNTALMNKGVGFDTQEAESLEAGFLKKPERSIFLTTVAERLSGPAHKVMNTMNLFVQLEIIYSYGSIESFLRIIGDNPVDFTFDRRRFYKMFSGNDGKYRYERLESGIIALRRAEFIFSNPGEETMLTFGLLNEGELTKDGQVRFQVPSKALYLLASRTGAAYIGVDLPQVNNSLNGMAALPLHELVLAVSSGVSGRYEISHERMKRGAGVPYEKGKKKDEWKTTLNAPSQIQREIIDKGLSEIRKTDFFESLDISSTKTSDGEITWYIDVEYKNDRLDNIPTELLPQLAIVIERLLEFGCEDLMDTIEDEYTLRYAEYCLNLASDKMPDASRVKNNRKAAYLRACFKNNKSAFARDYDEYRLKEIEKKRKREETNRELGRLQRIEHMNEYKHNLFLEWLAVASNADIQSMKQYAKKERPIYSRQIESMTVDDIKAGEVGDLILSSCRQYCMELNDITDEVVKEATKTWVFKHSSNT